MLPAASGSSIFIGPSRRANVSSLSAWAQNLAPSDNRGARTPRSPRQNSGEHGPTTNETSIFFCVLIISFLLALLLGHTAFRFILIRAQCKALVGCTPFHAACAVCKAKPQPADNSPMAGEENRKWLRRENGKSPNKQISSRSSFLRTKNEPAGPRVNNIYSSQRDGVVIRRPGG